MKTVARFQVTSTPAMIAATVALAAVSTTAAAGGPETADPGSAYWPQWRGPLGTGVAPHADPPTTWSERDNIRWRVALPGAGHATPIIWGDRLYVTAAVPYGDELPPRYSDAPGAHDNDPVTRRHEFLVIALDRRDGSTIWQTVVDRRLPFEQGHRTSSLASHSPVTDGELVFAFFGSHGLFCLDRDGVVRWKADLGRMRSKHGHGEASSPVLHGDTLVVNWDHEGQSALIALDKRTGDERWRVLRDEPTSWATPIVVEHGGVPQLVVPGTNRLRAYDLRTGAVIWSCGGLSNNIVASPVAGNGIVYAGSSYETRVVLAVRLEGAAGDITGTENVLWRRTRGAPYVPSPLLLEDTLYYLYHYQGVLSRIDGPSGAERPGRMRLTDITDVYASPVAAAGRIYVTDLEGTTVVLDHDDPTRVLAVNRLDEQFSASAAIVDDAIYLRGADILYCIAEE